jgi:hypothetical protein
MHVARLIAGLPRRATRGNADSLSNEAAQTLRPCGAVGRLVRLSRMRARMTTVLPVLVSVFVWTSTSIDAQQKPQTRKPTTTRSTQPRTTKPAPETSKPATEKPRAESSALAPGMVREVPLMQCPSVLGNGMRTQRLFCDILTGTEPQEGLRVSIPAHEGTATLLFTLHNRQAAIDEAPKDAAAKEASTAGAANENAAAKAAAKTFARYTAMLRVVMPNGTLVRQTVVQSEFRGPTDLVERIAGGAGRGGVKAVAPTGSETIALPLPAGVTEVSLLGEKLTIERIDGTEVITAPGRPIAVVSQVQVEYRPPAASGTRRRS